MKIHARGVDLPKFHGHTNRLKFLGVLGVVDAPSDKVPSGGRGHTVFITRDAALQSMDSLIGMAIDYRAGWEGHNERQKFGIITHAYLLGKRIVVSGIIYAKDFPEIVTVLRDHAGMGMSYEVGDACVEDMRQKVWKITELHFTGAAVLLRERAAYKSTRFWIAKD